MSIAFSKNKEKRSRSSSSEANNSFVKNVTSRVSGLLPATITRWFSSPGASPGNGSAPTADVTDSSSDDEAPESHHVSQPHAKRMRYSSPHAKYNHYGPTDINCVTFEDPEDERNPYNSVHSPAGGVTFRRQTSYVCTPLPSEDSSMDRSEKDLMFKSQHTVASMGQSVATKRKSLFDSPTTNATSVTACTKTSCNTMRNPNEPCFKPSLLGSPFYPGRTMYGGAAASYINRPNIKQRRNPLVKPSASNDNTISHSARRVMDLLDHYSSPLNDSRRIPLYVRASVNDSTNTTLDSPTSSPYGRKAISYKTHELHVPNIASILRLKQRSRLMDTTNAARQLIASHSSTSDYLPYPTSSASRDQSDKESSNKLTTKVKTRLTRPRRGESSDLETNIATPVILPNVVLKIDQDNLPKFSFGIPTPSSALVTSTPAPKLTLSTAIGKFSSASQNKPTAKISESLISKPETVSSNDLYKFSSPVRISSESQQATTTPPKFTFGNPERSIDTEKTIASKDDKSSDSAGTVKKTEKIAVTSNTKSTTTKSNDKEKPVKCSVCKLADRQAHVDKCVNCEKVKINNISKPFTTPATQDSKWKCEDCWVSNDVSADNCACCGAKNHKSTSAAPTISNANSKWKCEDCWVSNDVSVDKCACCGAKNHKSTSAAPTISNANSKWKCEDCWVSNDVSADNCACCGAKNHKSTSAAPTISNANSKWKCEDCWVSNDVSVDKCACCGAKNLKSTSAAPTASNAIVNDTESKWKCEDCWIQNKSCVNNCAACGGARPGVSSSAKPTGDSIKVPDKTTTDEWKCAICLGSNDGNRSMCFFCDAERPDPMKPKVAFNFGKNTMFKFGIALQAELAEKEKLTTTTPGKKDIEESETNNNVLAKAPTTFSFGITAKKSEDQPDSAKNADISAPKMNFSFGIPSQPAPEAPKATSILGTPNKLTESIPPRVTEDKERAQEVPSVDFSAPKAHSPLKLKSSMFAPPSTPQALQNKLSVSAALLSSPITIENKETTGLPSNQQAALSTGASTPPTTFSFVSSGLKIKPATNMFTPPASSSANISFKSPIQTAPVTSTVSLFSKSETTTTSSMSLTHGSISTFQKTGAQASSAAAPASAGAAGPLFNFGNVGGQTVVSQPDNNNKHNFNFTFGSTTKNESATPFKVSFGVKAENTSTNKFSLPIGNAIGSGNGLSSSTLGGGNGLPAGTAPGNVLGGGNGLPTNPLLSGKEMTNNSTPAGALFGTPTQKENMWSPSTNSSSNMFMPNSTTNNVQKQSFTFGSSSPFNSNNAAAPVFGSATQPTANVFGMNSHGTSAGGQPSMFASSPAPSAFGAGSGGVAIFGAPTASLPQFEQPAQAAAPAFNFGQPSSSGIFGFGQAQQQQMPQQAGGVYSFGAASAPAQAAGPVQFNMGSAPSVRRVRKAVRRNPR